MSVDISERIKRIQRHLNLEPDGKIGPITLTAIEQQLFSKTELAELEFSLTVSLAGLEKLVGFEISSDAYYRKKLSRPTFPGGASGVTIGIGYDLGYSSRSQIERDWRGVLPDFSVEKLLVIAGLKGDVAKQALSGVRRIEVSLDAAKQVLYRATLPRYAAMTGKAYPGVAKLFADAQAALLSLVFNRGTKMSGDTRREMKALKPLVQQQDYTGIAEQLRAMKRLWEGKGLDGLIKRREEEAKLVLGANRNYATDELVRV